MNNVFLENENLVLYEDNHLLVLNKPAGILSQGDKTGDASVVEMGKHYLKEKYNKPGNVFLGLAHRLDRPVSGAILCCKTSKSLTRINQMIAKREIDKIYHAICLSKPEPASGRIESWLLKDTNTNKVSSHNKNVPGSKLAILDYSYSQTLKTERHLIEIRLKTGRSHQIRVQLKHKGCPILGDLKYYSQKALPDKSIALHASALSFIHPVKKEKLTVDCSFPDRPWWNAVKF